MRQAPTSGVQGTARPDIEANAGCLPMTGQFTSVDAGSDAGQPAGVTPSPVSRLPSPVYPTPDSHKAAAGAAAMSEPRRDDLEGDAA